MKYIVRIDCYDLGREAYGDKIDMQFDTRIEAVSEMRKAAIDEMNSLNDPTADGWSKDWVYVAEMDGDEKIKVVMCFVEDGKSLPVTTYYIEKLHFVWKDIVEINGTTYAETFAISGDTDGDDDDRYYQIDDFLEAVAEKYNCNPGDIKTYMMDDIDFDVSKIPFGAEDCGCYINAVPEWIWK